MTAPARALTSAQAPKLLTEHDPLMEVRIGADTLVAVHKVEHAGLLIIKRWAVIATDLDGLYRATLATARGDQLPDAVLEQALLTADRMWGEPR